ncbi:MAG: hypothetical protein OXU78_09560 [Deltaproteobacteria bacterium]|nr:hypothetical protein [Deltaproteobacteria bacterium]
MVKQTRMRASSRDDRVRVFCPVLSFMVRNVWTVMHSGRRARGTPARLAHGIPYTAGAGVL